MNPQKLKSYFIFDIIWILIFVVFELTTNNDVTFLVNSILIGLMMIFGRSLSEISYIGQFLYWTAINIFKPKTKYNHWIWGLFIVVIGASSFIFSEKKTEQEEAFFQQLHQSSEFWLGMVLVIVFNLMVGLYTAKKNR